MPKAGSPKAGSPKAGSPKSVSPKAPSHNVALKAKKVASKGVRKPKAGSPKAGSPKSVSPKAPLRNAALKAKKASKGVRKPKEYQHKPLQRALERIRLVLIQAFTAAGVLCTSFETSLFEHGIFLNGNPFSTCREVLDDALDKSVYHVLDEDEIDSDPDGVLLSLAVPPDFNSKGHRINDIGDDLVRVVLYNNPNGDKVLEIVGLPDWR